MSQSRQFDNPALRELAQELTANPLRDAIKFYEGVDTAYTALLESNVHKESLLILIGIREAAIAEIERLKGER